MKKLLAILLSFVVIMSLAASSFAVTTVQIRGLSLVKTSISIEVGQTYTLKPVFKPADTSQKLLTFSVSDKTIASIDSTGSVTAIKPGTAVVTVVSKANNKISAKFNLTAVKSTKWPTKLVVGFLPNEDSTDDLKAANKIFKQDIQEYLKMPVESVICEDYNALVETMRNGKTDVGVFGPFSYIEAHDRSNAECIVTSAKNGDPKQAYYTSLFVTRADTGIKTLADVKGKSIAFVDPISTSGNLVPHGMLAKQFNMTTAQVDKDLFSSTQFSGSHNNSLMAVVNKTVDIAPMTRSTYETGLKNKVFTEGDLVIVAESDPIPNSPVAVRGDLSETLKAKIKEFYLQYNDLTNFKLRNAVGNRYIEIKDSNYDIVRQWAKAMGM